jgi:hypothetical protein
MNAKLLSISIVPMLLIGLAPSLASVRGNQSENWHSSRPSQRISPVIPFGSLKLLNGQAFTAQTSKAKSQNGIRLGTQQAPPIYLLAKDDKRKECLWLGLCDGKDKKK